MPIRPLLEGAPGVFGPDDIKVITVAFDDILQHLRLVDRNDPAVLMIAKLTMRFAIQGERDPVRLRDQVLRLVSN